MGFTVLDVTVEPRSELEPVPEPTLVVVGDILVSKSWVATPSGNAPLTSVTWTVTPMYHKVRRTPPLVIVLAVIGALFFLLGLLLLLIKEERIVGNVSVTVEAPGLFHVAYIPVAQQWTIDGVTVEVNKARALAAAAG